MTTSSLKFVPSLSALVLASSLACTAQAQTAPAEAAALPITGNFTLTSNYVSRGFTQSWSKPALQGGIDYAHSSGFFAGTWLSSISGTEFRGGTTEWDLYGGYSGTLGPIGYTAALYQYVYGGTSSPFVENRKYNYTEVKLGVSKDIFSFNVFYTISKDYFGTFTDGRGSLYLDLNANPDLGDGYTLQTHIGAGLIAKHSVANWVDYKLGLAKALPGNWTVTAAVTYAKDTDKFWTGSDFSLDSTGNTYTKRLGKAALALSIGKTF
jgi:uncharacterized protein (TIGR02001 family)